MQDLRERLQEQAAALWKMGLLHSLAVVFLLVSLLIPPLILRRTTAGLLSLVTSVTLVLIVMGVVRYQQMRDKLIRGLSVNRKAS